MPRAFNAAANLIVNFERFVRPVVDHVVLQTNPTVPRSLDMNLAFHVEVVIVAGKVHHAAVATTEPDHSVPAQYINVDPKCALDCWSPAASSAAESAHELPPIFRNQLSNGAALGT
jgi:hypothetical protein